MVQQEDRFLPEVEIRDDRILRADYEKLRVTYELQRDIGLELNLDQVFNRILERIFEFLNCDRAIILTVNENGEVVLQAFKVRNKSDKLIISSTLVKRVQIEKVGIISADALTDERFSGAQSIIMQKIRSSMAVPILHENELFGIMIVDSSSAVRAYHEKDLCLFANIARQTAQFIKIVEMAKKIESQAATRERFQRLLSPDLAEMVVSGELKVERGGESRLATVLFADIRDFTSLCENMEAAAVLEMLNEYYEVIIDIAFRYKGTVDKIMGDTLMLIWGAPVAHPVDPIHAIRAALDMQTALVGFNRIRESKGERSIQVGIGINTEVLVAGYIGSNRTMSYSVIGNGVNVASRLCSGAKGGEIIISEETYQQVSDRLDVVEIGPLKVKGKVKPLKVYKVIGEKQSSSADIRGV